MLKVNELVEFEGNLSEVKYLNDYYGVDKVNSLKYKSIYYISDIETDYIDINNSEKMYTIKDINSNEEVGFMFNDWELKKLYRSD